MAELVSLLQEGPDVFNLFEQGMTNKEVKEVFSIYFPNGEFEKKYKEAVRALKPSEQKYKYTNDILTKNKINKDVVYHSIENLIQSIKKSDCHETLWLGQSIHLEICNIGLEKSEGFLSEYLRFTKKLCVYSKSKQT